MKKFREYVLITIGFLIVSASAEFFLVPNNIAGGGVMGIAMILYNFTKPVVPQLSVGSMMLVMNMILFVVAFIVIGSKFGAKTIYSSLGLSGSLWIIEKIVPAGTAVTNNLLLATVFGTLISGIGMGLVFNQNASTGGTDIIAKIIHKFLHFEIGKSLLIVDFAVTVFGGLTFGIERGMFALLCVIINGFVIDNVIEGFNLCKQIMVVSNKNEIIRDYIIDDLERGCTLLQGVGGFSGENTFVIYTVLNRKEFIKLRDYIKKIDPKAFITVSNAHEVLGEGFNDIQGDD